MKCTIIIRERDLPTSTASRAWSVDGLPPYFVIHPKPFYYTPSSALPLGLRLYRNLRLIQLEHRGARAPDPKAEGRSLLDRSSGSARAAASLRSQRPLLRFFGSFCFCVLIP